MKRLKELRKTRGLSLKQMGVEIGVAESTMSLYENGKREPSHDTLQKLANFFNVSVDYLLGRSESPLPETQAQNNTELAVLFNKLRKDPLAVEVMKFFLNLSPKKKKPQRRFSLRRFFYIVTIS